jgi:hypothetical protein
METDNMLRDLYRLSEEKLGYEDYTFIGVCADRARADFDSSRLQPESRKLIMELHKKHCLGN